MSEENTGANNVANITSGVKEKDPRKVAAGKRLGGDIQVSKRG